MVNSYLSKYITKFWEGNKKMENFEKITFKSLKSQEYMLTDEILNGLLGFDNDLIKVSNKVGEINPCLDKTLVESAKRIIPICIQYIEFNEYIKRNNKFENGRINESFCECLQEIIKVKL
jgi:hypothetical protein